MRAGSLQLELFGAGRWTERIGPLPSAPRKRKAALLTFLDPSTVRRIETDHREIRREVESAWLRAMRDQWAAALALVALWEAFAGLREGDFLRQRARRTPRGEGQRRWQAGQWGPHLAALVKAGALDDDDRALLAEERRPVTRLDCLPGGPNEMRPCPWVSCRYHLGVEIGLDTPGQPYMRTMLEWDTDRGPSCALDVADQGGRMPTEIGNIIGLSKQGAVFTIRKALLRLADAAQSAGMAQEDVLRGLDAMREEVASERTPVPARPKEKA